MSEINSVISKIRSLVKMTTSNGCSEAEAMTYAEKVGELMKVYNLTMDKIFLNEAHFTTGVVKTGRKRNHPIVHCLLQIAAFCDCKTWMSHEWAGNGRERTYNFFGMDTDVEMAQYLYGVILKATTNALHDFKHSEIYKYKGEYGDAHRRSLTISFEHGMIRRIGQRLEVMTRARHTEETAKTSNVSLVDAISPELSTDIVFIKSNKVESEFEKLGLRLGSSTCGSGTRRNSEAQRAGHAAGDHVSLNRPLGGGKVAGYLS